MHLEHQHQAALIQWAHLTRLPDAADVEPGATIGVYLLAIVNGGYCVSTTTGARLKAEGLKPGVSDLLLPLRRQGYGGLWLELKSPGRKPTPEQAAWIARMRLAGYRAEWRQSWLAAAAVIADYVGVTPP